MIKITKFKYQICNKKEQSFLKKIFNFVLFTLKYFVQNNRNTSTDDVSRVFFYLIITPSKATILYN